MSSQTPNLHFVKPTGSENISRLDYNDNWDKTDDAYAVLNGGISNLASGIAIMADGNTHQAIPAGNYVYVRNHDSLTERMYTANSAIAENATLSANNLTPVPNGGLNSISDQIAKKSHGSSVVTAGSNVTIDGDTWVYSCGNIVEIQIGFKLTASTDTICTLDSSIIPSSNLWICAISNTDDRPEGNIIVYANGNVKAYGLTINKSYRIHVTYIK